MILIRRLGNADKLQRNRRDDYPLHDGWQGNDECQVHVGDKGKAILTKIHKGGSIGLHAHPTSDDVNFVLSGSGTAICDGVEEQLLAGCCHICPTGSSHSITNTGDEGLALMTLVVER